MIRALEKKKPDGELYTRVDTIETRIGVLERLSRDELLDLCALSKSHSDYVPSECLLYFVRASRSDNNDVWFERLYKILIQRVRRSLPRAESSDGETVSLTLERVRDQVLERFVHMLAADRIDYSTKLDFFEIRFDMALKRLRQDAEKPAWRDENRHVPLEYDEETGEVSAEVEQAVRGHNPPDDFEKMLENLDETSRLRLKAAIDGLPQEQTRTIQMLMLDFPMYSQDPKVMTIAKALGVKSDQTIRNYRDRAVKALRAALAQGDVT